MPELVTISAGPHGANHVRYVCLNHGGASASYHVRTELRVVDKRDHGRDRLIGANWPFVALLRVLPPGYHKQLRFSAQTQTAVWG